MLEGFRQARLFLDSVDREVHGGDAGVSEAIGDFGAQQPRVRREVNPKVFLRSVVNHLVNEVWAKQWFAASGSQNPARRALEPVNGAAGRVFRHSLNAIVVRPAIVAVQVAFPLSEKVGDDRLKLAGKNA